MAASKGRYSNDTINDKDSGNNKQILVLQPLALTEYLVAYDNGKSWSQMTDEEKKDDTGFKNKFFLDDVWHRKDTEGNECVIGLLANDSTTKKYQHHASSRRGKLRVKKNSTEYIVLNDGGLNTTADCKMHGNKPAANYTNFLKFIVDLYSAYYTNTDQFHLWLYKKVSNAWSYLYDWTIMITTDSPVLAARGKKEQFATSVKDLGGVSEGDELRAIVTSTNYEGKYPAYAGSYPTASEAANMPSGTYLDFTVRGAMYFVQLYYHEELSGSNLPSTTTQPITNRPYAMVVSEDMYDYNPNYPLQGGVLGILFHKSPDDPMNIQASDIPQGCSGTIEDAYDSEVGALSDGFYYGVPKTWNGSELVYIRIENNKLYWYGNPYVTANYTVSMTFEGTRQNGVITIKVYANLSGVWNSQQTSITTDVYEMGRTDTYLYTYTQAATSAKVLMGTFTITSDSTFRTKNTSGTPAPAATPTEGSISTITIPDTPDTPK